MDTLEKLYESSKLLRLFVFWTCFSVGLSYFLLLGLHIIHPKPKRKNIRGQLALVTGGASGLGRAIALKLAQEGCNIVIIDIDATNITLTVKDLQNEGVKAKGYLVDVSNIHEVQEMKKLANKEIGKFDIIINNAGILFARGICDEDPTNLQKMVNVNLMSHFWTTQTFLPDMIQRKRGHIVSISSLAGIIPCPAITTYATTKFAVRGFMEALATDLAHERLSEFIKTTVVYPYFIKTNQNLVDGYKSLIQDEVFELLSLEDATDQIVDAILREKEEAYIIKRSWKGIVLLFIVQALPFWLRKYFICRTITKGYKWDGLTRRNLTDSI